MLVTGNSAGRILFVSDFLRPNCAAEQLPIGDGLMVILKSAIQSAGLLEADYAITVLHPSMPPGGHNVQRITAEQRSADMLAFKEFLAASPANVIVPLGEYAMNQLCGLASISKWHCNVVRLKAEYEGRKAIPLYHPEYVYRCYGDFAYLAFGCQRIKLEMLTASNNEPQRQFRLGPSFADSMQILSELESADLLAVDIETGGGLINTVGFATSAESAVAIKTLPDSYTPEQYLQLWQAIARVLEGKSRKILQNFIYEATWFSRYGIDMQNTCFDTMWAMKFLHPEFDKGLDNVGRIYTPFPFWKDDNDDWAQIRDWSRHLRYNCCDTTGTFAAYQNQTAALETRKLSELFSYVMSFAPVIQEMCALGLRLDPAALQQLQEKLGREHENFMHILETEFSSRLQRTVNPRSPKQLQSALNALGLRLPTKRNKTTGLTNETADKKALVKLRRKYPNEPVLPALIGLSATNKQLSSYANFDYDKRTNRVHYQLDGCGTETGRWAGYNSGWGEGFNPQTVPKSVRKCFVADPGKQLIEIDLKQAESRYVAWDGPEPTLMQMINEGRDVHKYFAGKVFRKPEEIVNKQERNLGKKSGHAANYCVGPRTFAESCLVDMNLYMPDSEAKRIIETYFEVFPGIRTRQANIRKELSQKRFLRTPIGRERYFYGRMNDATFREAYAYVPQSTIPDITNHLMLKLWDLRDVFECEFLLQVHDSLLLQAPAERVMEIAEFANDLAAWHPRIELAGGQLLIPVDVESGDCWGKLRTI